MVNSSTVIHGSLSMQEVARRTGFSDATLRYYERVGLIPDVPRDPSSNHRRYAPVIADRLEALACLRASGMSIEDMRSYLDGVEHGDAETLVDLFAEHARRLRHEADAIEQRLRYVQSKAHLWQARLDEDPAAEVVALANASRAIERLRSEL